MHPRHVLMVMLAAAAAAAATVAGGDDALPGDSGDAAQTAGDAAGAAYSAADVAVSIGDVQRCSCLSATACRIRANNSSGRASLRSCACSACLAPAHGTGRCSNGVCDIRCDRGFTSTARADGRGYTCTRTVTTVEAECGCVASTGSCLLRGSRLPPGTTLLQGAGCPCSTCGASTDPNAVPSCGVDGRCASTCVAGTFRCDASKQCRAAYASDPAKCGASCRACPSPAHGRATCMLGMCDVTCNAGYVPSTAGGGGLNCVHASEASAAVFCSDSSTCTFGDMWVGGYGMLSGFDRAKRTWSTRYPEAYVYGMAIVSDSKAVAVGGHEYWLWSKSGGRGAWVMSEHDNAELWGVAAGKDLRGRDIVWMVGDHGRVIGLNDDGAAYSNSLVTINGNSVLTARLSDVTATGPNAAVAVGSDGGIALLSGGIESPAGWTWARPPNAGAANLTAVSGWGGSGRATVLWAVGRRATVLTSRDQGRSWTMVPPSVLGVPADIDLFGVVAVSGSEAWVVGAHGTILHWEAPSKRSQRYAPSGIWSRVSVPLAQDLYTVWLDRRFRTPVVWAAGDESVLLVRPSSSWEIVQQPSTGAYYAGATTYQLAPPRRYSAADGDVTASGEAEPAEAAVQPVAANVNSRCTLSEKEVQQTAKAAGNDVTSTVQYPLCPTGGSSLPLAQCQMTSSGQVSCSGATSGCALIKDLRGAHRYAWFSRLDSSGAPVQSSGVDASGRPVEETLSSAPQLAPCIMADQLQWPTGTMPTLCNGSPRVGNSYVDPDVLAKAGSCSIANPTLFTGLVSPSASWRQQANVGVNAMLLRFGMLSHMAYFASDKDTDKQAFYQCLQPPGGYSQLDWHMPGWLTGNGTAQVHVYYDDANIIFAYRGSDADEAQDWWTNLNATQVPIVLADTGKNTTVQVHAGFYTATQGLNDKISDFISNGLGGPGGRKLWFTGHSQGGALAMLGAATVPRLLYGESRAAYAKVGGVIPFAGPYVGDPSFRTYYNSLLGNKTARVQYWLDPVPWLFDPRSRNYYHVGFALELCGKRPGPWPTTLINGLNMGVINLNGGDTTCPYMLTGHFDQHHHGIAGTVNALLLLGKEQGFSGIGGSVGCVLAMGAQCPQEITNGGVDCENIFRCNWVSNKTLCRFCPGANEFDADNTCVTEWGFPSGPCKAGAGAIDSYRCVAP